MIITFVNRKVRFIVKIFVWNAGRKEQGAERSTVVIN